MKTITKKLLFVLVFVSAMVVSCTNDVELNNIEKEVQIDHALVTPIGVIGVTAEEFITRMTDPEFIYLTEDGKIGMEIIDNFEFDFRKVNLLSYVNPLNCAGTLTATSITVPVGGSQEFTIPTAFAWDLGVNDNIAEERIEEAILETLRLNANLALSNLTGSTEVTVKMIFAGTPGGLTYVVGALNTVQSVSFNNVTIMFDPDNSLGVVPVTLALTVKNTGSSPLDISNTVNFTFNAIPAAMDYEVLYGYFAPQQTSKTHSYSITFTEDLQYGTIRVKDPSITFDISNSVGTPINLGVSNVVFSNNAGNVSEALKFGGNPSFGFSIAQPGVGQTVTKQQVFDNSNVNFDDAFAKEIFPGNFSVTTSVGAGNASPRAFLHKNSKITVDFKTILPFEFEQGSYFFIVDTLDGIELNIEENLRIDESTPLHIVEAAIVLNISNGLPFEVELKPVFYDSTITKILNFATEATYNISAPNIDAQGYAVGPFNEQQIVIEIESGHIGLLDELRNIVYTMYVNSKDAKDANIRNTDKIEIRAGVYVKVKADYNYENKE